MFSFGIALTRIDKLDEFRIFQDLLDEYKFMFTQSSVSKMTVKFTLFWLVVQWKRGDGAKR